MRDWLVLVLAGALLLSACQSPEPERSPLAPDRSQVSPYPSPAARAQAAEDLLPQVAEALDMEAEALTMISIEAVEWPDASLGCPEPGRSYAQVVTPGWRLVYRDAAGEAHEVHTPQNMQHFVICDAPERETLVPEEESVNPPVVEAAIRVVTERFGFAREEIEVRSVEYVEWRNSCLGCEAPGDVCLMVITPGARVVLAHNGELYQVHTNASGSTAILCDRGNSLAPPESKLPPFTGKKLA